MGSFISNVGLYTMNLNNMKLWNICKLRDQDIMMAIFIVAWIKLVSEFKQIIHILHSKWKFSHHLFHVIPNLYEFFFLWNTKLLFFWKISIQWKSVGSSVVLDLTDFRELDKNSGIKFRNAYISPIHHIFQLLLNR